MAATERKILNRKIFRGVVWKSIEKVLENGFSFLVKLVLARLLLPEHFGLIGMAVVFTGLIQTMSNLGMNAALIQRKQKELDDEDYDTAFWAGLSWGALLFIVVSLIVAPFAAWFYEEPILKNVVVALAVSLLLKPLVMVHEVDLNRELDFRPLAFAYNSSQFLGGIIAIAMAYLGFGVWSLVVHPVAITLFKIPFLWRINSWRPRFRFSKASFEKIFGFGMFITGTQLLNFLYNNIDYLLIGKLVGATSLGIYTLAFLLTDTIRSKTMNIMNKVMYPVYGKEQENREQLKEYYIKIVKYNCIVLYPVMGILFLYADEILLLAFGDQWSESAVPLQILSIAVMVHLLANSNTVLLRGMGKPNMEMYIQAFKVVFVFIPSIFIGVYFWGITGAAFAVLLNKIIAVVIAQVVLNKMIGIRLGELLTELYEVLTIFLVTTSLFYGLQQVYGSYVILSISSYALILYLMMIYLISDFRNKIVDVIYG